MLTIELLLALGFLIFAGLCLLLLVHSDRQRRRHRARLQRGRVGETAQIAKTPRRKSAEKPSRHDVTARIERELSQTSLRLKPAELLVQMAIATLSIFALSVLVLGLSPLLALPVALGLPLLAAKLFLRLARLRYRAAFTDQLPEALDIFARGLRAGRPVADSLAIVVSNSKGPVGIEFSRCHDEITMGTTLTDSLDRLEARVPTPEVSFFSVATALQAETGGNLIETMEGLANQLRERRKLRKKARALSSEARASALILASLPFAVALAIAVLNLSYLAPLYTDPRGQTMSAVAVASIAMGVWMMARMGKLDV
jgi:tight adherence protein B